MKNYLLLWVTGALVIFSHYGYSQTGQWDIGVQLGGTSNSLYTGEGLRAFTRHESRLGAQLGVPVRYHVNEWFGVQSEASFIQKNYSVYRTGYFEGIGEDITNVYLQIPLLAHFSFGGERLRGFVNLGGFGGYWLNSRRIGSAIDVFAPGQELDGNNNGGTYIDRYAPYDYNERIPFDPERDRRFEFGLLSGVGIQYQISPQYTIFSEVRYHYSLTDLQKTYMLNQVPRYNNTLGVQIGLFYHLPNRR